MAEEDDKRMDKEIIVTERPETVSWEAISSVLRTAHMENVKNGIVLPYPHLSPDELREKVEGRGGKMFVALCAGKLIATGAVAIIEKNLWCGTGKYAYCFLASVLPEYKGMGAYRRIETEQEKYASAQGVMRCMFDTDERNQRILEISKRNGYRLVEFRVREGRNSVVLVKWLEECPFSRLKCWMKYHMIRFRKLLRRKL